MQKVLIISYFFPPCGLTAAWRVDSWARYFHRHGLYPVVITRNWDHPVQGQEDILKPGGSDIVHERHEHYEVYYLPHTGSLRDRLYTKLAGTALRSLTKPLTVAELVGQHYAAAWAPFGYLARKARTLLQQDPSIRYLLISANPFILFRYGYALKKEFPQLQWVADYRDDWTTSEINPKEGWLRKKIHGLESRSEKKWLSNAAFITSVSPHYTDKIAAYTGRPGHTIYNGFDPLPEKELTPSSSREFSIVFNGTLYATQRVEDFCDAARRLIMQYPEVPIRLKFPGLAFDRRQEERVRQCLTGLESHTEITGRIPRAEVMRIQQDSQVLLLLSHPGVKGIASSKLFEYLSLRKPILVYPGDGDIMDRIIRETRCGYTAQTPDELYNLLEQMLHAYIRDGHTSIQPETAALEAYTRERQAGNLAALILRLSADQAV